jgi:hypothetical protein
MIVIILFYYDMAKTNYPNLIIMCQKIKSDRQGILYIYLSLLDLYDTIIVK